MFTLILIGFLTFLLYFYYQHKYSYWRKRGVKGPKAYPILGTYLEETWLPADQTEFALYKKYGSVFGTYYNTQPVFNTSEPEYIKAILNDLHTFPNISSVQFNDNFLAKSIFFRSDAYWKNGRAAQTHYYTSKNLRSLIIHLEKTTKNFIENLEGIRRKTGNDVDIKMMTKYFSIDCISKVLFAIDVDSYKERNTVFVKSVARLGELNFVEQALCTLLPRSVAEYFSLQPFNLRPVNSLGKYFSRIIEERKKAGVKYNDLLEALQNAVDNDKVKMTTDVVIGNCLLSFFAGVEGVSNLIGNLFYYLSEYPEIQEKLRDEVTRKFSNEITYEELMQNEYLDAVVQETLRLGANFLLLTRYAAVNTKIGDIPIDKGTEIRLLTHAGHNAFDRWNDARTFKPERFLKNADANQDNFFIPFGLGPKQCLGMRLALLEAKFLLVNLLKKYEFCKPKSSGYSMTSFRGFLTVSTQNIAFKELAK